MTKLTGDPVLQIVASARERGEKLELCGANLGETEQLRAKLGEADLSRASLSQTGLRETNLSSADLSRVDLNKNVFLK